MTIAIVGMGCRYPDAADPGQLWETVLGRRRGFRLLPEQRLGQGYRGPESDQTYVTHAGLLSGWEFDRLRFGVPGPLFRAVDLTHWLALQTAAEALADSGFPDAAGLDRERVGVVLGNSLTGEFSRASMLRLRWPYTMRVATEALARAGVPAGQADQALAAMRDLVRQTFPEPGDESLAGALSNTIAGRVCNHFDFHGTGYTVDGACASSLLAVMTACRALSAGELDFALAGGVDLSLDPFELVGFARMSALAEGGEMRVYDSRPTGFLPGEGCGVVALMRAEDARRQGLRAYASIAGWGTSSDGSGGLTRPEEEGQARALRRAYEMAGIDPASVDLVEGHGTGTAVGDRVELLALNRVRVSGSAALGSLKANIGHTKAAAGVAGLIKAALAVHYRVLPPTTGCQEPHELLRHASSTVRVLPEPEPWPRQEAVAGVSSMGFGGINAHVVLRGEPRPATALSASAIRHSRAVPEHEIVLLSANDRADLGARVTALAATAASLSAAELHDVAVTAYRAHMPNAAVRCGLVARTPEELATTAGHAVRALTGWNGGVHVDRGFVLAGRGRARIGLLFPGQAAPVRAQLADWAEQLGVPAGVWPRDGATGTAMAQPAIVRQSLAALAWLRSVGCRPAAVAGHSLGEITALVCAGALSDVEGLALAADRGRIMAEHGATATTMAGVGLPADEVESLLEGTSVTISGINAATQTTVAGAEAEVRRVVERARRTGVPATLLPVSHGFHSEAMRAAVAPLAERLSHVSFAAPELPVFSTITGAVLDGTSDPAALLVEQLTRPVRFTEALAGLTERCDLLVEVGPGATLAPLVTGLPIVSMDAGGDGRGHAMTCAVLAAVSAADIDPWFADRPHRPIGIGDAPVLIGNPCETELTAPPRPVEATSDGGGTDALTLLRKHLSRALELPLSSVRPESTLLGDLHLNSLQVLQIVAEVAATLGLRVPVISDAVAEATVADTAALLADQPPAVTAAPETGLRPWVRVFEHRWVPWDNPARAGDARWSALAPDGHWLHTVVNRSTMDTTDRAGLAVWLDDSSELSEVLRAIAVLMPDVVTVLHGGHPAATAVARSAAAELGCVAGSVELPVDAHDADLSLAGECARVRADGRVERMSTAVRTMSSGTIALTGGDVCIVTGGVTGITAYCGAALAERTGCTLVVLGRAPEDAPHVQDGLRPGKHYISCDVTDPAQVRTAVARARDLGPVRGLIHGAGVNEPRLMKDVTAQSLELTCLPKVDGLRNLLAALEPDLRLVAGFGSIIGRRGLTGQSEYCVANELLRVELERWAQAHPLCRTRVLEWSAWSGAGMAERMGVLSALRDQGIVPIEPELGAEAMLDVLADDRAPVTLLVSGRFPAGPTLSLDGPAHEPLRFSSDVLVRVPGVEAVLEPSISTGTDPYLDDHRIDGVPVLPAVAGMEAAAQAAAAIVGEQHGWSFTDIDLSAPITVDERGSRTLRVAALVAADGSVDVAIRDDIDRFRATVRPAPPAPAPRAASTPMTASGPHPFYGPLLFHTGRMRPLVDYEYLSAFEVRAWIHAGAGEWFSGFHSQRLLIGDLAVHDAAIHVLLACLPHRVALPVGAERVTVWQQPRGALLVSARERMHENDEYVYDVRLDSADGTAVACWEGLRLRAVGPRIWREPLPARLIGPLLSRRLIECGIADHVTLVSDVDGIAGAVWSAPVDDDEGDGLAAAIAHKADEPPAIAAARVKCARDACSGRSLVIEEVVDDVLVVLRAGTTRVMTAKLATTVADPLVVAVATEEG